MVIVVKVIGEQVMFYIVWGYMNLGLYGLRVIGVYGYREIMINC